MLLQVKYSQPYQLSEVKKYIIGFDCAIYDTTCSMIGTNDIHMAAGDREVSECANCGGPA